MHYELITAFSLVKTTNTLGINELVNEKLKQGYQLYGDPGIVLNHNGILMYYQAVTKPSADNAK